MRLSLGDDVARVLRMPDVADDPSSATLTAWLVGESGDFVGAQSLATVETDTSLLSIEVAEPGILIKLLVEPGDHVEPGSPLAVLGEPGEVVEDVEDLMVTLGLAVATEAHDAGAHLRALPTDDPLYATTWPPHHPTDPVDAEAVETAELAEGVELAEAVEPTEPAEPVELDEGAEPAELAEGVEPTDADADADADAEVIDLPELAGPREPAELLVQAASVPPADVEADSPVAVETSGAVDGYLAVDEPVVVRRVVGWADSVAEAVLNAVGVVVEPRTTAAAPVRSAPAAPVPATPALPQVRLRDTVRADELLTIVAKLDAVSLIALVVKAVAVTSRRVPLRGGHASTIDVAVQRWTGAGTVTPVVHVANLMTVSSLTATLADLDTRSRDGRLAAGELEPASVTVVDLGSEGVAEGAVDASLAHPVVLTIGAVRVEPVVELGVLVPGRVVAVTLACDANRIDPGTAGRWLACLAGLLEQPLGFLT